MASGLLGIVSVTALLLFAILFADGVAVKDILKQIQHLKSKGPLRVTIAVLNSRGKTNLKRRHSEISVFGKGVRPSLPM